MFQNPFGSIAPRHASTLWIMWTCWLRLHESVSLICLLAAVSMPPLEAALPALHNPPWFGFYAVYADKNYEFKITSAEGSVTLVPLGEGAPVLGNLLIHVHIGIMETHPDGKTVFHPVRADTLDSTDAATDKLGKSVMRGKTAGDAVIEITLEQSRGVVFMGGRVLEPGTLAHSLGASITVVFPNVNPPEGAEIHGEELNEREAKRAAKKLAREAEDRLKDDSLSLRGLDGQRKKIQSRIIERGIFYPVVP
jgi:hypothetical protein